MHSISSKINAFFDKFPFAILISLVLLQMPFFSGKTLASTYYVNGDIAASGDGATWPNAFKTIQEAVNAAGEGDEIWLKMGTYPLSSQIDVDKAVSLYGGFKGDETQKEERNRTTNVTTIDGQDSVYHCLYITADATIDGLTITGGNANGVSPDYRGGGLYIYQSSATIINCTISENTADYGGGVYNLSSYPSITSCTFSKNSAVKSGAGIYNNDSSPTITDCTFSGNSAEFGGTIFNDKASSPTIANSTLSSNSAKYGGSIYNNDNTSAIISNSIFTQNTATKSGGGIYNNDNSSPTITDCIFSGNSAEFGGGIYNDKASPAITNCSFSDNNATNSGGGLRNNESSPTITGCSFSGNSAGWGGGIINRNSSSPSITNCTFASNTAVNKGGGIYNELNSSPKIEKSAFSENTANYGGGIHNYQSSPTIIGCSIFGNNANSGGGIENHSSSATIADCIISENSASENSGGGIYNIESSPTIINCIIWGNNAIIYGGGIFSDNSSPIITNCTLSGNNAVWGGGVHNWDTSSIISNCILWGNTAQHGSEMYNENSSPAVTYCAIPSGYKGEGNISADPHFVDPQGGDFRLQATSPCIDKGSNSAPGIPGYDFEGDDRILDGDNDSAATADMGADEYTFIDTDSDGLPDDWENTYFENLSQESSSDYDGDGVSNKEEYEAGTDPTYAPTRLYVSSNVASSGTGTDWDKPFKTIQEAVDSAHEGDEVWVKMGTYDLSSQINVDKAVAIYGGFSGNETQRDERDWTINLTTIDGKGAVYHCLSITADATIDGFTITGGNASGSWPDSDGGGIYNYRSFTLISNCTIIGNNARSNGGGIYSKNSSPAITNCVIKKNTAKEWNGGGIYNDNSSTTISNCEISANRAHYTGGGIDNAIDSFPNITNCTFKENSAEVFDGGAIYNDNSLPTISTCIFSNNSAARNGGAIHSSDNSPSIITGSTFVGNSAKIRGGGICNGKSSSVIINCTLWNNNGGEAGGAIGNYQSAPTITNCILWGDTALDGPEIYNDETSNPAVTYSDIQGGYSGEGNIDSDPLFADPSNNDFHITSISPCIDKGNNNALAIPTSDFEGDPRIADGDNDGTSTVDIGADEYAFIDTDKDGLPDDWELSNFGDLTEGAAADYDGDGISNINEYQARTDPTNAAPQADAGVDQKVDEGVTVTLDASGSSDPDGSISSYLWTQIDGTAVTLSDKTIAMPTFTAPNVDPSGESLTFQVTVADNNGEQAVDTCSITITWINLPQYVNSHAQASGTGTSWDTAFKTIQEAVNAAGEGDEIWLTKGTYLLTSQINVNKAIGIYGGFKGDEIKKEERDWANNITIIDGKGSVFHCFFISKDAAIDGLTITGGNANGSWPDNSGGGIFIEKSSPSISNCNISKNSARWGGGIQSYQSSPTITNCTLSENTALNSGGALYNNESPSNITNCTISKNTADWGGGIYNNSSSGIIATCAISGNTAKGNGGSIYNNDSSPSITNCTIYENNADWGGAIFNQKSSPAIATCSISGNTATNNGGSICNKDSSPTITNCTISMSTAPFGAGIYNYTSSSPTITNCTLSGNSSTGGGGGMRSKESSSPTVTNSIFWNNTAPHGPEIYNDETSNPTINYSDIQGGYSGEGNIDSDPLFYNPLKNDFHITSASPCIDKGNNNAAGIPTKDFDGDPRICDGNHDGTAKADIGADEYNDTDHDGLPDYWEVEYFNDLGQGPDADYDGDGITNVEEYHAGTDPASKADGDVAPLGSRDGKVNVGDALVALRFALGLETPSPEDISHGDVAPLDAENKPRPDGQITVGDALVILRKALNIISF